MKDKKDFLYGGSIYTGPNEDVEHVIKKMLASGINIVRFGEVCNSWAKVEYTQGKYDFSILDTLFEACEKYGMKIILGSGTADPPIWFEEKYPESLITDASGHTYPRNAAYSWVCSDSDDFVNLSEQYITNLVERYKKSPSLYAYQIHNEIGFPFMPLSGDQINIYCYCQHSKRKFREFLKQKYNNSLDELNYAYTWITTNTQYISWEQVEPPHAMPYAWSSVTRWLDFRLFAMQGFTDFVKWQNGLIKSLDPHHITSTNIFFMKSQDRLASLTAIDQFDIAKHVDCIGYDIYPGSGNKLEKKPEFSSILLDHGRSVAKFAGKEYWLLESESGPINGWTAGPHRNTTRVDILRNNFDSLGHQVKLILFMQYKAMPFIPLLWGEVLDVDGKETRNYAAVKEISEFLKAEGDNIINAKVADSEVAILINKENNIVARGMDLEDFAAGAITGMYRHFWEKGYTIDFINTENLKLHASNYKVIVLPFCPYVSMDLIEVLDNYVARGGILIATSRLSMLDEKAWLRSEFPHGTLAEIFGLRAKYTTVVKDHPWVWYKGRGYQGYHHKDEIELTSANPIAYFEDDTIAVAENEYGKGNAVFFGTHADLAHLEGSDLLWDITNEVCEKCNVKPKMYLEYTNRTNKEFDAHYLTSEHYDYIIITHYLAEKSKLFKGSYKMLNIYIDADFNKVVLDSSKKEIAYKDMGAYKLIELQIPKGEVIVLKLYGRDSSIST